MYSYLIYGEKVCKIGRSINPWSRLKQHQTSNAEELEMIVFQEFEEKELHDLFSNLRIREKGNGNEWFRKTGNLKAVIEGNKKISRNSKGKLIICSKEKTKKNRTPGLLKQLLSWTPGRKKKN